MKASTWDALVVLLALSAGVQGGRTGPRRMMHQKRAMDLLHEHDRRQGGIPVISVPGINQPPAASSQETESSGAVATPSSTVPPPVANTPSSTPVSTPPPATSTTSSTTSSAPPPTRSSTTPSSVAQAQSSNSVINVTRTSTIPASSNSASAVAASQSSAPEPSSSSGLGKGTIIAIIVVASSCAGVFLLWTIFRRWKLKPTRTFEDRLQPINFGPDEKADFEPTAGSGGQLSRNDSTGSRGSDRPLRRQDSYGSMAGSQRGGANGSQRGGGAMSESGSRSNFSQPSYPPRNNWTNFAPSPPPGQMPYSVPSQPRLANPYGSEYGGGVARSDTMSTDRRYGDGYARY